MTGVCCHILAGLAMTTSSIAIHRSVRRTARFACVLAFVALGPFHVIVADAQIKARVRPAPTPAWDKGIQPISAESYYNAIECGKQGGDNPACVFWDTDLCKNDDFELAWYTAYKQVAYEVWAAVRQKKPAPQPSYGAAQRTRVTIGITPVKGATNVLTDFVVKRSGKPAEPVERSLSSSGGRFTFDYPAFAPTATVTLELVGKERTLSCAIPPGVLRQLR
jgi:hypothetical protein